MKDEVESHLGDLADELNQVMNDGELVYPYHLRTALSACGLEVNKAGDMKASFVNGYCRAFPDDREPPVEEIEAAWKLFGRTLSDG